MNKFLFAAAFAASTAFAGAASASSAQDQLNLCVAELDARGVASVGDYRPRFKGVRGGGVKRVTVLMTPLSGEGDEFEATCSIKRGEVVDVDIKG